MLQPTFWQKTIVDVLHSLTCFIITMEVSDAVGKLKTLDELAAMCATLRAEGKKVSLCHGVFDLLHPGHIRHFQAAKQQFGDVLVVTLTRDAFVNKGPGRPVFPEQLRAETIAAIGCVDYVALNDPTATGLPAIQKIQPDFYVKGSEYENMQGGVTGGRLREKEAVESYGGSMVFTHEVTFSSTNLLNQFFNVYPEDAQAYLRAFRGRYQADAVVAALEKIRPMKVLVVGDAVIDEYHYTRPLGKTGKESIVATKYMNEEAFAGGVFALANHVAGFCDTVDMVTCLGARDSREELIRGQLKQNVTPTFFYRDDTVTTVKRRFVDAQFFNKLHEVYYFEDTPLPTPVEEQMWHHLMDTLPTYDCVIVLDYAHGLLSADMINLICSRSGFLAVNTQTNAANIGFNSILKYPRLDFACLSEPETRLATRDRHTSLESVMRRVAEQTGARRVLVTRGANGSLGYTPEEGFFPTPVLSQKVVDRVGAGDALLGIAAPAVAAGLPMDMVGFLGGVAGAIAVTIVGNKSTLSFQDVARAVKTMLG